MKIALFLNSIGLSNVSSEATKIVVFHIENGKVIEVENESFKGNSIHNLSGWLLSKQIMEIYVSEIDKTTKQFFNKLKIAVKTKDELKDNWLFNSFVF